MQATKKAEAEKKKSPDLTLVLSRLEKAVIHADDPQRCRLVLEKESLWKAAGPGVQLKLARLAQIAGETEGALKVLTHINQSEPGLTEAWTERFELLFILGRRKELAQVLAVSRESVGKDCCRTWMKMIDDSPTSGFDRDMDASAVPFEDLHRREQAIRRYLNLFSGRKECFARQWVDKAEKKQGYVPVRRPMEPQDVDDHLAGRKTYGIYLLQNDARVKTAVLDADLIKKFRQTKLKAEDKSVVRRERHYLVSKVKDLAQEIGLNPLIEFSGGKGFHFWFFFEPPAEAAFVRKVLDRIKRSVSDDLSSFNLEVFPKQDSLSGKGLGNLVKLPLGVHRLTGKRSFFIKCSDRSNEAQLNVLKDIQPADPAELSLQGNDSDTAHIIVHPRWEKWAGDYPELCQLEKMCPPIAQVIATCRNGGGISVKEEKVIFQTLGFLPRAKTLLHYLAALLTEYNPHLVDFKLSRLRGTPLGCRRIHTLLNFAGDYCRFDPSVAYFHPLLHLTQWKEDLKSKAEKVENLTSALENLKVAMSQVQRFIK